MQEIIKKHLTIEKARTQVTVHNIGMLAIVVVALSVSWTSTKIIQRNYGLLKEISVLEQKVRLDELAVENQKLMNEYYKTDAYLEIAARKQFNKALPGEKLMLVPKALAIQKVSDLIPSQVTGPEQKEGLRKWQQWMRFLSGRAISD